MPKSGHNQLGFVVEPDAPPLQQHHHHHQQQQQQPHYPPPSGYPQSQQPYYPSQQPAPHFYPPQPAFQNQPFPGPIQHQPGVNQPNQNNWFTNANFYDYLRNSTTFHVKQKVELLEAIIGWETPNKYTVKDQSGNKIFYVGEESGCLGRQCLASRRPFTLLVKDTLGHDVLMFERGFDCQCCCGLICPDSLSISTLNGQRLGSVQEEFNILHPRYKLLDAFGNTVLRIKGPCCPISFGACSDNVFRVVNRDDVPVGTIVKKWSGLARELFTDADYFSMTYPVDLDPSMKAVCLGALFLIDFGFFESNADGGQGGRRLFG